ncbi:cytidine deaminase [Elongatibacter sediminis]|uniref:Cytidine deaminase n=1 Tax=Elongatibacter sediminis TaxID=3119006 RepID=A0AAW9RBZ6_9GAMM
MDIDLAGLRAQAEAAREAAWAPYSGFKVGAAILDGAGGVHVGCNVENASFGLTSCAERNALAAAVVSGAEILLALVIYSPGDVPWSPCGACRQCINELMPADAEVHSCCSAGAVRSWRVDELLPDTFSIHHR